MSDMKGRVKEDQQPRLWDQVHQKLIIGTVIRVKVCIFFPVRCTKENNDHLQQAY